MTPRMTKIIAASLTLGFIVQLTGCGYLLYPERKGQSGGNIDPAVAIMDGLGLLLFLVPGVVAFAVDITNGTIYLPHGKRSRLSQAEMEQVIHDKQVNQQALVDALKAKGLVDKNLSAADLQISAVQTTAQAEAQLAVFDLVYASNN